MSRLTRIIRPKKLFADGGLTRRLHCRSLDLIGATIDSFERRKYERLGLQPLQLDFAIPHEHFHLFVDSQKETIWKTPRRDTLHGRRLRHSLANASSFAAYRDAVEQASRDPDIGAFVISPTRIDRSGAYTSPYIQGWSLAELWKSLIFHGKLPMGLDAEEFVHACRKLEDGIKALAQRENKLFGDWAPHNLIFNPQRAHIYNVDLEGFSTYQDGKPHVFLEILPDYALRHIMSLAKLVGLIASCDKAKPQILSILNLIENAKQRRGPSYSGVDYPTAYHSLELGQWNFYGQRDCRARLEHVPFSFQGKRVVDIGTSCGGMLHCIGSQVESGLGLDRDPQLLHIAKSVAALNHRPNLEFKHLDLDDEQSDNLNNVLTQERPDIIFLLSMCMWLPNWQNILRCCASHADSLLLETNGDKWQQEAQRDTAQELFQSVLHLSEKSLDDPGQQARKLFLCSDSLLKCDDKYLPSGESWRLKNKKALGQQTLANMRES